MSSDIVIATKRTGRPRVVTREVAEAVARTLLSSPTHTIESAAVACGVRGGTIRELLRRYHADASASDEDEEIGALLDDAKMTHIRRIREFGFIAAGKGNAASVAWAKWQLEIQDPLNHPRRTEAALELSGPGGAPIQTEHESKVKYVVMVPETEAEEHESAAAS